VEIYQPKKDHFHHVQPGFTVGGPIMKDRLWFFLGFAPQIDSLVRKVDFTPATLAGNSALGVQHFTRDQKTYFTTLRLDATLTQKVRVFGSWLNQYQRASGISLPPRDPITQESGLLNLGINTPLTQYSHSLGYSNPNATYNVGGDITITPHIVSTTRYGYFFNNYHDFGWPTSGVDFVFQASGQGAMDTAGNALPAALQLPAGASTAPFDSNFTEVNASKHYQFNQDFAFFKGGWWGTHNFKVGYQYNRLTNVINQHGNLPQVFVFPGAGQSYAASTTFGGANCDALMAVYGGCEGQDGYVEVQDFATVLKDTSGRVAPAIDNNHALYAQDSWTIGHRLTLDLGLRVEKEDLPAPKGVGIPTIRTIHFNWGDKVEPRLGAAWGSANGKIKVFGSYGVVNDVMKLLLAQTSFGAQAFETCTYPLTVPASSASTFSLSSLDFTFGTLPRACPTGVSNVGALFASGTTPSTLVDPATGVGLIENVNFRPEEPIAPGLKPYRQHEAVFGVDYQLLKNVAFEARYDRRRLDHVIEDASLSDPNHFEIYNIVNPGEGVNKTIDGYAAFLTSLGDAYGPGTAAFNSPPSFGTCPSCPPNPKAVRSYDGVELRVTKGLSSNWGGMFSYTYSHLRGNYAGLTTTDQIDGGITGRNSPDTTRSFDEPFYYFGANGLSNNGPLPTDRPNALKAYGYYTLPWWGNTNKTTFGIFTAAYSGSPVSAHTDVGLVIPEGIFPFPIEALYPFGRGKWVNITGTPGNLTFSAPFDRRTPWYSQTDFNISHAIKVNHNNEAQTLTLSAEFTNLLNQRSVTAYWEGFNSAFNGSQLFPFSIFNGASFYQQVESGYNVQAQANSAGLVLNSLYGQPLLWQSPRSIRLGVAFTF
jgi:outer membrane receptor protein involved in Fe transport